MNARLPCDFRKTQTLAVERLQASRLYNDLCDEAVCLRKSRELDSVLIRSIFNFNHGVSRFKPHKQACVI